MAREAGYYDAGMPETGGVEDALTQLPLHKVLPRPTKVSIKDYVYGKPTKSQSNTKGQSDTAKKSRKHTRAKSKQSSSSSGTRPRHRLPAVPRQATNVASKRKGTRKSASAVTSTFSSSRNRHKKVQVLRKPTAGRRLGQWDSDSELALALDQNVQRQFEENIRTFQDTGWRKEANNFSFQSRPKPRSWVRNTKVTAEFRVEFDPTVMSRQLERNKAKFGQMPELHMDTFTVAGRRRARRELNDALAFVYKKLPSPQATNTTREGRPWNEFNKKSALGSGNAVSKNVQKAARASARTRNAREKAADGPQSVAHSPKAARVAPRKASSRAMSPNELRLRREWEPLAKSASQRSIAADQGSSAQDHRSPSPRAAMSPHQQQLRETWEPRAQAAHRDTYQSPTTHAVHSSDKKKVFSRAMSQKEHQLRQEWEDKAHDSLRSAAAAAAAQTDCESNAQPKPSLSPKHQQLRDKWEERAKSANEGAAEESEDDDSYDDYDDEWGSESDGEGGRRRVRIRKKVLNAAQAALRFAKLGAEVDDYNDGDFSD